VSRKDDRILRLSRLIVQQCDQEELVVVMTALCHAMLNIVEENSPSENAMRCAIDTTCCMLIAGMDEMLKMHPRETPQ
jgi:hypothetical protein